MASTSQLLTWIELECQGWQREGRRGSRALLNEAHKILNCRQVEQNVILDSSTGNLPFMATTDGTYRYNAPSNVWMIGAILIDALTSIDYGTRFEEDFLGLEEYLFGGYTYYRVRNIRTKPWDRNSVAWVQFNRFNPGTTTAVYRRLAWRRPTDIISDSIQHDMPEGMDVKYLMPATISLIEAINDHDKFNKTLQWIATGLAQQYWNESESGDQGQSDFITKRAY